VKIRWARGALEDVDRLAEFIAAYDPARADAVERQLSETPKSLLQFPRRGSRLTEFSPREVREFRVGDYLLRYELADTDIYVLRFFHAREDRFRR
jgi:plasmid stabilization system protein ParE